MMRTTLFSPITSGLLGAVLLLGCASNGERPAADTCNNCGEIRSIEQGTARSSDARGGSLDQALTPAGQSLSAGNLQTGELQRLSQRLGTGRELGITELRGAAPRLVRVYEVTVDMDRGPSQRVVVENIAGLRIGKRVRVVGDQLLPAP